VIPEKLIRRDKALLTQVQQQSNDAVSKVLPDLKSLTQQGAGAVFRKVTIGTLATFGNVAHVASKASYSGMRAAAVPLAEDLNVTNLFKVTDEAIEPVVGFAMSKFVSGNIAEAGTALASSVGLAVANAYRSNEVSLANDDPVASGYQRVAAPGACAFCAFAAATANITTGWDGDYHDHCSCTTVPVFKNVSMFRPAYYDQYQMDAQDAEAQITADHDATYAAFRQANPGARRKDYFKAYPQNSVTTKNILARMRATGAYH
jgi:hypothetical protein